MLYHANTNHIYGLKDKINKYAAEKRIKPQVVCFSVFNTTMTSRRIYSTWTIPYNNRISSNSLFKKIVIKSVEAHESNNELNNEQLISLEKNKRYTLIFKIHILKNNYYNICLLTSMLFWIIHVWLFYDNINWLGYVDVLHF